MESHAGHKVIVSSSFSSTIFRRDSGSVSFVFRKKIGWCNMSGIAGYISAMKAFFMGVFVLLKPAPHIAPIHPMNAPFSDSLAIIPMMFVNCA
jgi:hypothetical protein